MTAFILVFLISSVLAYLAGDLAARSINQNWRAGSPQFAAAVLWLAATIALLAVFTVYWIKAGGAA